MNTRETFQDWAELLPQIAFEIDIEGKITYANQQAFDAFGYTHEEIDQGLYALQMFIPEDRGRIKAIIARLLDGERIPELELTAVRKDGSAFPVITYGAPITEEENPIGVRGFIVDISERKQTENALIESETKFRTIFENANDEIVYLDETGTVIEVNKRIEDIFGWKPEEVIGKSFTELPFLEPKNIQVLRQEFHQGIDSGAEILTTYEAQKKDGNPVSVEASTRIIQLEGGAKYSLVIVRDITERKQVEKELQQKEEYFRSLIENAADGIVIVGGDAKVNYYGPSVERMLGMKAEEQLGQNALDLVHPDDLPKATQIFTELLQKPGETVRTELRGQRNDAPWRILEITGCNLLNNQAVNGIVFNFRDITKRKEAEDALKFRSAFESLITTISTKFINLSPEEIDSEITEALKLIGEFAEVDRSYVFQYSEDGTTISNTHEWCAEGIEPQIDNLQDLSVEEASWMMDTLDQSDVFYIPCVADLPPEAALEKELLEAQDIQSLIMVPMKCGGSSLGAVGFDSVRTRHVWSDDGIKLLQMAGQILANALARKHAEQVIHQSEQQFREIFENASDEILYMDEVGTVIRVNDRVYDIFGYSPDEVVGKNFFDFDFLDPEAMEEMINRFGEALNTKVTDLISFEARRRDRSPVHVEANTRLVEGDGETKGILVIIRDVTERNKAEEDLRESEKKYSTLFNEARDGIVLTDVETGKITDCNPCFEMLTGRDKKQLQTMHIWEIRPPEKIELARAKFLEIKEKGFGGSSQLEFQRPDGEIVDIEFVAKETIIQGKHLFLSISRDVTERKQAERALQKAYEEVEDRVKERTAELAEANIQLVDEIAERIRAEEALRNSEERFRSIIENSHDVIVLVSTEGKTLYASPSIERITGYAVDERENNPFWELIHPDDMPRVTENFTKILSAPGATESIELRLKRKDGEWRWVAGTGKNFLDNPILRAIVCNYRDVTERKQAEEALKESEKKYSTLVANANDGVAIIQDESYKFVNPAWAQTTGYSIAELMEMSIVDVLTPEFAELVIERYKSRIAGAEPPPVYEVKITRKDGVIRDVELSASVIEYQGKPADMAILRDITDRKRSEAQLQQYSAELQDANEELARYAEVASHDICTPLRAIRYYTHLLRKGPENTSIEDHQNYLNTIDTAVHEGENLAKNLLELSRLGQNEIRMEKVDVGKLLEKVIVSSGLSEDVGIVMKKKWPTIDTDPTLLGQIFRNLIDNAVKFRSDPTGRIELSWKAVDDQGYEFTVRDYGIGIDPSHHEEIFEIFKQLHHKEEYQGTGIGLAIVKKAASRLGGSVQIKSKLGKGSSFIFTITRYASSDRSEQETLQRTRKRGFSTARRKSRSS